MQPGEIDMITAVTTWHLLGHVFSTPLSHLILTKPCKGYIRSLSKYILSTCYVPTTLPGAREPMRTRQTRFFFSSPGTSSAG